MNAAELAAYQPSDTLYLWWLGQAERPLLIGELQTARSLQGVSLRYAASWLASGFALSEDLPLKDMVFLPTAKGTAAGAVDDARPDRWGERVIRVLDKPPRLSLMEFLLYAGDERFGALGVSVSKEHYRPRWLGPLPQLAEVEAIAQLVRQIVNGEPIDPQQKRLIAAGASLGGARPKALLNLEGQPWVLKFAESDEPVDTPLIEHASMTLAAKAGIRVARTRPITLHKGHAVAVKRFDRDGTQRLHAISANVALRAAGEVMGYPELAQLLRRRGVAEGRVYLDHMRELFRRMVFNILIDNTDDHEKNHVLLMTARGDYALSPAFDVLPSGQALGYQQMRVGADEADATLSNALSEHSQFGLKAAEAIEQVRQVCAVVSGWQAHFVSCDVSSTDIDSLAEQIDRPFMLDQRGTYR